jgi:hypothetical protein
MTLDALRSELERQISGGDHIVRILRALNAVSMPAPPNVAALLTTQLEVSDDLSITAATLASGDGSSIDLTGTASVVGLTGASLRVTFTASVKSYPDIEVVVTPASGWRFGASFPTLSGTPVDKLHLVEPVFVFTTAASGAYEWKDGAGAPQTAKLSQGLNFIADLIPNDVIGLLSAIVQQDGKTLHLPLAGTIDTGPLAAGAPSPDIAVQAPLVRAKVPAPPELGLTLGAPAVTIVKRAGVSDGPGVVPRVYLSVPLMVNEKPLLTIVAPLSVQGQCLSFWVEASNGVLSLAEIEALVFKQPITADLPDFLKEAFRKVGFKSFQLDLLTPSMQPARVAVTVGSGGDPWRISDLVTVTDTTLAFVILDPLGRKQVIRTFTAEISLFPKVFTGTFDLLVEDHDEGGVLVSAEYHGSVSLNTLIKEMTDGAIQIPSALVEVTFEDFGFMFSKEADGWDWRMYGKSDAKFSIPLFSGPVDATLMANVTSVGGKRSYQVVGSLKIGTAFFSLELDIGPAGKILTGKWAMSGGSSLGFGEIASFFGYTLPALPEDLDLGLKDAEFYYDLGSESATVVVSAHSKNYGQILFATMVPGKSSPNSGKRVYIFSLAVPLNLRLSDLRVVGASLPAEVKLEVEDIQVIIASNELLSQDMIVLNALIVNTLQGVPLTPTTLGEGLTFASTIRLGSQTPSIVIPLTRRGAGGDKQPVPPRVPPASALAATAVATAPDPRYEAGAKWIDIGKNFGPVQLERVGIQYQNSVLSFLVDATLSFSGLALSCQGLGAGSGLTKFSPVFHLDGLAIGFSSGEVTIDGGLLAAPSGNLSPGVEFEYIGAVTIAIEPWMIAGVGAYAKVKGASSFFLLAQVRGEFGGPPAFFITGFMGGFGYNSRLAIPAPDDVSTFPFVAGLDSPVFGEKPTPMSVLAVLEGNGDAPAVVSPSVGDNWIAAGIMFRSYELVLGRALLVVEFGQEFEVALLGLASMSLPQGATTKAYAYIELQLEVDFKPADGYFGLTASLTPASFVLTKDCHLTGGFAFFLWFGSNAHAGDFVVTVGGYHPAFDRPSWYPQVSPVGFNWQVDSEVAIKGGAYFALTPSAIMAGGSLEALYQSGSVKAWFNAYSNLLITWKPFHFNAQIGISVGASVRLDLLFTTVTFSFELGATLDLWGPRTGGIVHIHLYILSFSVPFGSQDAAKPPPAIAWSEFAALLPHSTGPATPAALSSTSGTGAAPLVLGVQINRGLTRQDADGAWYVRGDDLQFSTSTAVPATSFSFKPTKGMTEPAPAPSGITPPSSIAIRPMGIAKAISEHTVTLTFVDGRNAPQDLQAWAPEVLGSNLPEALWGAPLPPDTKPAPSAATIPNLPTGVRLFAPAAAAGHSPGAMSTSSLTDVIAVGGNPLTPGSQVDPIPPPVTDSGSIAKIIATLGTSTTRSAQQGILAALAAAQAAPPTDAQLTKLAVEAGHAFTQPPLLQQKA